MFKPCYSLIIDITCCSHPPVSPFCFSPPPAEPRLWLFPAGARNSGIPMKPAGTWWTTVPLLPIAPSPRRQPAESGRPLFRRPERDGSSFKDTSAFGRPFYKSTTWRALGSHLAYRKCSSPVSPRTQFVRPARLVGSRFAAAEAALLRWRSGWAPGSWSLPPAVSETH